METITLYQKIALVSAGCASVISLFGLLGLFLSIPLLSSFGMDFKPIASSAALVWIFFGTILFISVIRPFFGGIKHIIGGLVALFTLYGIVEFFLSIQGNHIYFETVLNETIATVINRQLTYISPVAAFLIVPSGIGIVTFLYRSDLEPRLRQVNDNFGLFGCITGLVSFTFLLSYLYGSPLLYGTSFIPIAVPSALSAFLIGISLMAAGGPSGFPISYLSGSSIRAQLLRNFLPLTACIILFISFVQVPYFSLVKTQDVLFFGVFFMVLIVGTWFLVTRISIQIGNRIQREEEARREAENLLRLKNIDLSAAYEEISASEEELKQNYEELMEKEETLQETLDVLAENEHKFHSLFETMQEGVILHEVVYDTAGNPEDYLIMELNPACEAHAGIIPQEAKGRLASRFYGVTPAPYLDIYAKVANTGKPVLFETYFEPMDKTFLISVFSPKKGWFATVFSDISERKRIQQDLIETNSIFDKAQGIAHLGNWHYDIVHDTMKLSDELYRIFGYEPGTADLQLDRIRQSLHPDDQNKFDSTYTKAIETWEFDPGEYRIIRPDSSVRDVYVAGQVYADDTDRVIRLLGVVQDISDRKEMERMLQEKNEELERFFTVTLDLLGVADMSGYFISLNPAFEKTLGYTLKELLAEPFFNFIHPDDLERTHDAIATLSNQQLVINFENRYRCRDGSYRWLEWCSYPYGNRIYAAARDITWRKEAEESLKALNREVTFEKEKAQGYFDVAGSLLLTLNTSGFITLINQKGCEILGLPKDEIIGKNWFTTFVPERMREEVYGVFTEIMTGNFEPIEYYENPVLTASGEERILAWHNSILFDDTGGVAEILSSANDITEKIRIEKEREDLIRDLEHKNAELERFVYLVSHDLKSPLITIEGFLGYLEKDAQKPDPAGMQDDILRIRNATTKMSHLLKDLLELSRVGRMINPSEYIPFSDLAGEACELLSGPINSGSVTVLIMPDLPTVFGDHTRLLEVVLNLVENAVKFMGDQQNPKIEIGGKDTGTVYAFYVKDNGIGIEKQYHEKIFGLFEKLHPKSDGSGIGLAIVKRIIELHGGKIWVASEPGIGTTFFFTLPIETITDIRKNAGDLQ